MIDEILNTCKYYRNKNKYEKSKRRYNYGDEYDHGDPNTSLMLYIQGNNGLDQEQNAEGEIKFRQEIPEEFIESSLANCTSVEQADSLALLFLKKYNKHGNRLTLIRTIMHRFARRNNLSYIVRVLKGVCMEEREEIVEGCN